MVVIDGIKVPIDSIVRIEGMYIYTDNYMKLCPSREEMQQILDKI